MRWIICYDICDDKRRRRVADYLQQIGVRVQYSVFECELKSGREIDIAKKLDLLIDENEDNVTLYMQCKSCSQRNNNLGRRTTVCVPPSVIII